MTIQSSRSDTCLLRDIVQTDVCARSGESFLGDF
jgi:hypothetical protein